MLKKKKKEIYYLLVIYQFINKIDNNRKTRLLKCYYIVNRKY